jgi:hypothetical protein
VLYWNNEVSAANEVSELQQLKIIDDDNRNAAQQHSVAKHSTTAASSEQSLPSWSLLLASNDNDDK